MTKLAYSYIRFSQLSQAKGGSLVRQVELAEEYAAKHGMTLDTTLKMRDLGKSGFSGKNVTDGALGNFVKAIEKGIVPAGSYLLIEDIDRLSRLPVMEALAVFQSIINGGVIVVVLKDGKQYSNESLKVDWIELMPILVSMGRAHEESQRKSVHLSKAWKAKKVAAVDERKPLGNNAPRWLQFNKATKQYDVLPARVHAVRRIFEMCIEGKGRHATSVALTAEGIEPFKAEVWGTTHISRILNSRAVLGEYDPKTNRVSDGTPVIGFFPQIVSEEMFNQAYIANKSRYIHKSTKTTADFNVWNGIAKCAHCDSSMYCITKGKKGGKYTYRYLTCAHTRKSVCKSKPIRYDESELVFAEILAKVGDKSLADDSNALKAKQLQVKEGAIQIAEERLVDTLAVFEESPSKSVGAMISKQEAAIDSLKEEVIKLRLDLAADTIIDKKAFLAAIDLTDKQTRQDANELLKRLKITVRIDGDLKHYMVEEDSKSVLDIYDDEKGLRLLPATSKMQGTVYDQDDKFLPVTIDYDPDFIEDEHI